MKEKIAAGLLALLTSTIQADPWADIQIGYSPQIGQTTRLEGGNDNIYGFVDITDGDKYGELRLTKNIGKFGLAAEYNGGDGIEDTVRFGATYTTSFGEGNFTIFKVLPIDTADKGVQLSIYSSQELTDKLTGSVLVDENISGGTLAELDLMYKLKNDWSVYGRVSDFDGSTAFLAGVRYDF